MRLILNCLSSAILTHLMTASDCFKLFHTFLYGRFHEESSFLEFLQYT